MTENRLGFQPDPLFDVSGQVIVITGGGGALPGALARGLAERGARIALVTRTISKAETMASEIRARGGQAIALAGDVTDRASLETAAEKILDSFGRIDHLVNGAGGNQPGATAITAQAFFELPPQELRAVIDLNLMGTILPSQVFGKHIAAQKRGSILNLSSMAAQRPLTRVVGYGAAKAALDNFTRWLAVTLAREISPGLRVNAIAPGFFPGAQNRALLMNDAGELTPRGQAIVAHTPIGRFGEPDDLLATAIWLLSPGAAFVTGVVVPVDGGFSAFSGV
jgi:NAD(P)-dependent dehydrogenase (short-subunit alcohol dehydrogenase family)